MTDTCIVCGKDLVLPHGKMDTRLAVVVSEPQKDDINNGLVLSGAYSTILRNEMMRYKLDLKQFFKMSIWQHEDNKNDLCFKTGFDALSKYRDKFDVILLVGATAVNSVTGISVSKIGGLRYKEETIFGSRTTIIPCISIGSAFMAVGEIRFALQTLAEVIESRKK